MYNKFRDSKMILVIIQVMAPAMAVLFLDRLFKQEGLIGNKKLWMGSVAGVALIGLILLASVVVTALYVAVVYLRSWINSCENDADKKHWRE
jgi:uncharacterized membrane protein YedE/YeeE